MESNIHNILIIDDNTDFRKALIVRLKGLFPNAKIIEYDPIAEGQPPAQFGLEAYDVLILDYFLGGDETGLDWFRNYNKTEHFPATLILTGVESEEIAERVLKAGVHHYLNKKQLTKGELYKGIEKALAVRARRLLISSAHLQASA